MSKEMKTVENEGSQQNNPVLSIDIEKFVHFGCWNNLNKELNDKTNLNNVIEHIKSKLTDDNKIRLITVAGDNYYPYKKVSKDENGFDKKEKITRLENLRNGFKLVKTLKDSSGSQLEIDMIMGNHDYENTTEHTIEPLQIKTNKSECVITYSEKEITSEDSVIDLNFYKARIIANKTLLLMIDTSVYTDKEETKDYINCINVFLNENQSIENIIHFQNEFIKNSIKEGIEKHKINKIVFIGHHPLCQIKTKKKMSNLSSDITNFFSVLLENYDPSIEKYYYLCADYHSYQHGFVKLKGENTSMEIEQYISGTGGTELDDDLTGDYYDKNGKIRADKQNHISTSNKMIEYSLMDNRHDWGYLVCEPLSNTLQCTFEPVSLQTHPVEKRKKFGGKITRKIKRLNRVFLKKKIRKSNKLKIKIKKY